MTGSSRGRGTDSGLYVLVIEVARRIRVRVGALGECEFPAGWYLYVGSARRHLRRRVARHQARAKRRRWHIDFLTSHPAARVVDVILLPQTPRSECEVNRTVAGAVLGSAPVRGFGASDCGAGCEAHLWLAGRPVSAEDLRQRLRDPGPTGPPRPPIPRDQRGTDTDTVP